MTEDLSSGDAMAEDKHASRRKIIEYLAFPKVAIQIIDDYLLKGDHSIELVKDSLAIIAGTRWEWNLKTSGLENGLPEDPNEIVDALLQLRLKFADGYFDDSLIKQLLAIRTLYQLVKNYMDLPTDAKLFDTKFHRVMREHKFVGVSSMSHGLAYALALYGPLSTDSPELQRASISAECSILLRRLEQTWRSIVG